MAIDPKTAQVWNDRFYAYPCGCVEHVVGVSSRWPRRVPPGRVAVRVDVPCGIHRRWTDNAAHRAVLRRLSHNTQDR